MRGNTNPYQTISCKCYGDVFVGVQGGAGDKKMKRGALLVAEYQIQE